VAVETDRGLETAERLAPVLDLRTLGSADRRAHGEWPETAQP
jgi:hypothetical protein